MKVNQQIIGVEKSLENQILVIKGEQRKHIINMVEKFNQKYRKMSLL
jgi:hypothetical protein